MKAIIKSKPSDDFKAFFLPPRITIGQGITLEATDRRYPPERWKLHLIIHNADNNHDTQATPTATGYRFDIPPERTATWSPGPHLAVLYGISPSHARRTFRRNLWVVIAAPEPAPSTENDKPPPL